MMWLGRFVCFTGGLFVEVVLADVVEDGGGNEFWSGGLLR
jgi:hypothetical protein